MKFIKRHWLIILILVLAAFARLYRLPDTLTFLEDEGRDLLIVKRMIDTKRPVLIGPQTSTGNMYLGPFYYYFITPALIISQMDPIGPAVLIALSGVLTVYLLYIFGKEWFGKKAGTLAALMYAILPLPVLFTRNSWNPNLVPLVSLLTTWLVVKLSDNSRRPLHYLLLGLMFGILVQLHYMTLIFIGIAALFVYLPKLRTGKEFIRGVVLGLFGFVLVLLPFIVFEFRNEFVNTQALTRFVQSKDEHAIRYSIPLDLVVSKFTLTSTRLFSSQFGRGAQSEDPSKNIITIIGILTIIFGTITAFRSRKKPSAFKYLILSLLFIPSLLALVIYQENIHLHYIGFFFPLTYLLVAGLSSLNRSTRFLSFIIVFATLFYSLPTTYGYLGSGSTKQSLRAHEVIDYIANDIGNEPYNIISSSTTNTSPFQYFAFLLDNPPSNSFESNLFIICQGSECSKKDINSTWLYITGPSHPTLSNYLGHPLYNYYGGKRVVISNKHAAQGVWVARLEVEKPDNP